MMRHDCDDADLFLLGLLGDGRHGAELASLDPDGWKEVLKRAEWHRLLPSIHARIERGEVTTEIPDWVAHHLKRAHRDSALMALAQRSELFGTVELLTGGGIASVALKGAWLAWYAYPTAAERPLRDIDILVPQERALDAFELLLANGYRQIEGSAMPPKDMIDSAKHFPRLATPGSVDLELHIHAWEPQRAMEWTMPPLRDRQMLEGARIGGPGDPCRYPAAQDMLMHLVIHAAYSHRFDVGPLLLDDIRYLLDRDPIDWPLFWSDADKGGWLNGAALVFAVIDRWAVAGLLQSSRCPAIPDAALIDDCERLLLQDPDRRLDVGLIAASKAPGSGRIGNILRRIGGKNRQRLAPDGSTGDHFLEWAIRRGRSWLASFPDPQTQANAARMNRVGQFLSR